MTLPIVSLSDGRKHTWDVRMRQDFEKSGSSSTEAALAAWPSEIEHLRAIGREGQAEKLESKLKKLHALQEGKNSDG